MLQIDILAPLCGLGVAGFAYVALTILMFYKTLWERYTFGDDGHDLGV